MNIIAKIKGSWKSWTMWFNGLSGAALMGLPTLQDSLPQLQPYIGGAHFKRIMAAVIVGNILLRFKTKSALEQK